MPFDIDGRCRQKKARDMSRSFPPEKVCLLGACHLNANVSKWNIKLQAGNRRLWDRNLETIWSLI